MTRADVEKALGPEIPLDGDCFTMEKPTLHRFDAAARRLRTLIGGVSEEACTYKVYGRAFQDAKPGIAGVGTHYVARQLRSLEIFFGKESFESVLSALVDAYGEGVSGSIVVEPAFAGGPTKTADAVSWVEGKYVLLLQRDPDIPNLFYVTFDDQGVLGQVPHGSPSDAAKLTF